MAGQLLGCLHARVRAADQTERVRWVATLVAGVLSVGLLAAAAEAPAFERQVALVRAADSGQVDDTGEDAELTTGALAAPTVAELAPDAVASRPVSPIEISVPTTGALPTGRGMWIWKPEVTEGGNAAAIVARAQQVGLNHLYVRTGSSVQGFHGAEFLDQILPAAHEAGIRVYGWDFPYFRDVQEDIDRSMTAITHQAPGGHTIDGFVPDIETPAEGTNLTVENATAYGNGLRAAVGEDYPLIVTVPRPSSVMTGGRYPYDAIVEPYDAIIPMVYWLNRQPDTDVAGALDWLSRYDKPIIPVGQAYDGAAEGGRPGPPPPDEIQRFLTTAEAHGATGVSFWSWQHATAEIWQVYADAPEFTRALDVAAPALSAEEIQSIQVLLSAKGHPVPVTGAWDPPTVEALRVFQRALGLEVNGLVDEATWTALDGDGRGLIVGS